VSQSFLYPLLQCIHLIAHGNGVKGLLAQERPIHQHFGEFRMKKSLIALAVLASAGAAMAQSSVTIYGRLDAGVGTRDKGTGSDSKMFTGGDVGLTTPRLGFRGSEDLGGGLKVNFQLEQRIDLDSGAQQPTKANGVDVPGFKGAATVGLAGGFGQIRAGRMLTVYDDVRALSNSRNLFDSNGLTPTASVFKTISGTKTKNADYSSRFNSQLRYDMPVMGGVYGGVSYAFEQTSGKGDKLVGFMLGYKAGGLDVALGYQDEKTKNKYTTLAGAYDMGSFAVSAGYNRRNGTLTADGDDDEYNLGVEVPVGAFKLSAGYAAGKTKNVTSTAKSSGFGVGGTYSLSKRTRLYAGYSKVEEKTAGKVTGKDTILSLGVRHDF